jgi:hypothetical protein
MEGQPSITVHWSWKFSQDLAAYPEPVVILGSGPQQSKRTSSVLRIFQFLLAMSQSKKMPNN